MTEELTTREQRATLLPGGPRALFAVLFWRASCPDAVAARQRYGGIDWPRCFRAVAVELDAAPEVAAWFDIATVPTLAVVTDGALLGIEYECTRAACRRLADSGQSQYSMMRSMSS